MDLPIGEWYSPIPAQGATDIYLTCSTYVVAGKLLFCVTKTILDNKIRTICTDKNTYKFHSCLNKDALRKVRLNGRLVLLFFYTSLVLLICKYRSHLKYPDRDSLWQ